MTFTGSQFRDKYEIEPRTWYRNLHSVTEYFYFTGLISSKLLQIIYYKNGVKMMRGLIKYSLWVCLFGLSFGLVDYNSEIQPIFNSACTSCHGSSAGLDLSSYNNIMMGSNNGDVVIPYDHASSELWVRVNSGQMPLGNNDLTDEQVDLIAQWIDEGALGSSSGCTDPNAYNCEDSMAGEYINEVGPIIYDYSCDGDPTHAGLEDCSAEEICEGYYDPEATEDDGSCRYPQAPYGDEVVFDIEENGISADWSAFNPPSTALEYLDSYHVQRCVGEGCTWVAGFTPGDINITTSFFDEFVYEDGVEIKYAIAVKYENNPYWGWAIGASYITPVALGDMNGDGGWNVLDIVALANCVLAANCGGIEGGLPADMNGDGNYNVLDIVALANCVLADNCGG